MAQEVLGLEIVFASEADHSDHTKHGGYIVSLDDCWIADFDTATSAAAYFDMQRGARHNSIELPSTLRDGKVVQHGALTVGPASRWIQGEWQ